MYLQVPMVWGIFLDWLLLRETWMSVSVVYLEGERNRRSSSSGWPSKSPLWAAGALLCWYSGRPCEEPALADPSGGCRSWIIQTSALVIPWLKAEGGCLHSFLEVCMPCGPPLHARGTALQHRLAAMGQQGQAQHGAQRWDRGLWMGACGTWCRWSRVAAYLAIQS